MNYLVDSDVLSEPTKPAADPAVVAWLERHAPEVAVDPIILGEIRFGISTTPAGKRRRELERWFDEGVTNIACMTWDAASGLRWADLLSRLHAAGQTIPIKDSLIAATALVQGLTVVTRNTRDFGRTGVKVLNPFA